MAYCFNPDPLTKLCIDALGKTTITILTEAADESMASLSSVAAADAATSLLATGTASFPLLS
jgi:hypothetical protein